MIHIDTIEALYLLILGPAWAITIGAEHAARIAVRELREYPTSTRAIVAHGNLRRERFRLATQTALLSLAIPSIESDVANALTYFTVVLIAVSLFVLANTLSDLTMRRQVQAKGADEIELERESSQSRMEARLTAISDAAVVQAARLEKKLDANTVISQGARDDAKVAADVANHINDKLEVNRETLVAQGAAIIAQGDRQDRRDAAADKLQGVADDTHEKVDDIHEVTVHGEGTA